MNNGQGRTTSKQSEGSSACRRIALYSHETMGLGHLRRNLLIAEALSRSALQPTILLITGAREASAFALPRGVDCVTLPAVRKSMDGQYYARGLDVSFADLIALRSNIIRATLDAFQADVFIVDKVPRGTGHELDAALQSMQASGHTRCVLGLRDILDEPGAVQREWLRDGNCEATHNYYDAVWIYGDPTIYDAVHEYNFSAEIARKVRYTGYLDRHVPAPATARDEALAAFDLPPGRMVLCMVGGGQDGALVAEAFAQAEFPAGSNGVLVTGPFMPPEVQHRLRRLAATKPRLKLLGFIADPSPLLRHADRVIAMGGYNTVCEVLSHEKHALIIPRVKPRQEQLIRAQRLSEHHLLDMLHPDEVTPQALKAWLEQNDKPPHGARERINFDGLAVLPHLLQELLSDNPAVQDGQCAACERSH